MSNTDPDAGYVNGDVLDAHNVNSAVVGVDYDHPADQPAVSDDDAADADTAGTGSGAFDPSEHTVDGVNAYLADHPEERDAVLDAEKAGKARVTLVEALESQ